MKLRYTGYKVVLIAVGARRRGVETLHIASGGSMAILAGKVAHTADTGQKAREVAAPRCLQWFPSAQINDNA